MKALHKLLAGTAVVLLCLSRMPLLAQELAVNPTTLSWTASQVAEQVLYIGTDEEWEIIDYGTFIVDQTEGFGSEFVHVRPAGVNSGSTPIQATMTVRTTSGAGASVYVYLSQAASEGGGGGGGGDPTPDPVERIALPGNWILNRTYTDAAGTSSFEDITF